MSEKILKISNPSGLTKVKLIKLLKNANIKVNTKLRKDAIVKFFTKQQIILEQENNQETSESSEQESLDERSTENESNSEEENQQEEEENLETEETTNEEDEIAEEEEKEQEEVTTQSEEEIKSLNNDQNMTTQDLKQEKKMKTIKENKQEKEKEEEKIGNDSEEENIDEGMLNQLKNEFQQKDYQIMKRKSELKTPQLTNTTKKKQKCKRKRKSKSQKNLKKKLNRFGTQPRRKKRDKIIHHNLIQSEKLNRKRIFQSEWYEDVNYLKEHDTEEEEEKDINKELFSQRYHFEKSKSKNKKFNAQKYKNRRLLARNKNKNQNKNTNKNLNLIETSENSNQFSNISPKDRMLPLAKLLSSQKNNMNVIPRRIQIQQQENGFGENSSGSGSDDVVNYNEEDNNFSENPTNNNIDQPFLNFQLENEPSHPNNSLNNKNENNYTLNSGDGEDDYSNGFINEVILNKNPIGNGTEKENKINNSNYNDNANVNYNYNGGGNENENENENENAEYSSETEISLLQTKIQNEDLSDNDLTGLNNSDDYKLNINYSQTKNLINRSTYSTNNFGNLTINQVCIYNLFVIFFTVFFIFAIYYLIKFYFK
ncbi:hypothetical protein M0813_21569 [Anaeramoeba flamelloides]|uniref:SAP domain-containing protein n=1 Tax=Anaeramoeba flamelloides TaxID=1746091 RepID=A0ABQ8YII2_9EUKA|nr:hypothetical protein M0813_21569 [Anaeramoeba flamelloides]